MRKAEVQGLIDDTINLYNQHHTKTFKMLRKSRVFKQLWRTVTDDERILSLVVLERISTKRQPYAQKLKLKRLPKQDDLDWFREYFGE